MVELGIGERGDAQSSRVLLFCTCFSPHQYTWKMRYRRWVEAVRSTSVRFDQLLVVDDGSPEMPLWQDAAFLFDDGPVVSQSSAPLVVYHFGQRLGRVDLSNFPGWHRSFSFAAQYAKANNFGKIIHLESDAYFISREMCRFVNSIDQGWVTPWSRCHGFPEMAIQVIAGEHVRAFDSWASRPYSEMIGICHERSLPYSAVVKDLIGDRYEGAVPRNADFATQQPSDRSEEHYWWLERNDLKALSQRAPYAIEKREAFRRDDLGSNKELRICFDAAGNSQEYLAGGWSGGEPDGRWSVGPESAIRFPEIDASRDRVISLIVMPFVKEPLLPYRRVILIWNEVIIGEIKISRSCELLFRINHEMCSPSENMLRILLPSPSDISSIISDSSEERPLGLFFREALVQALGENGSADISRLQLGPDGIKYFDDKTIILAHVRGRGDILAGPADVVGDPGSGRWVEGFVLQASSLFAAEEIEYQVVSSKATISDPYIGGEFAGSRGRSDPICGLRLRLRGAALRRLRLSYQGWFSDGSSSGPVSAGVLCVHPEGLPLEAFRIDFVPLHNDGQGAEST